jgi:hypothetical protein
MVAMVLIVVLPPVLGVDSRDGNDWVNHSRVG